MFNDLIRGVRGLGQGENFSVSLPEDEDGFFDRKCPDERCKAEFKVFSQDWKARVPNERAYCPLCHHQAPSEEWATAAQVEYVQAVAFAHLKRRVHGILVRSARRFNQRQRPAFITLSLSVRPDTTPVFLPKAVGDAMRQRFTCEICCCRYSSIGVAYFCLACGHNSVLTTFEQTLSTVRNAIVAIPAIRQAMVDDRDGAQDTIRLLLDLSMGRLVGAFEHYTEKLFSTLKTALTSKVTRGIFQRFDDASKLWRQAVGKGYDDILSAPEMQDLVRLVQQRHLLTHRNGIVDADYIRKSGDIAYALGQRITIHEGDVPRLTHLVEKLGRELRAAVP